jgi:glutamine synthetase
VTPREVIALCREKDVKAVDFWLVDLLGTWHHFTIPVGKLDEDVFEDGLGFNGATLRGWQPVHESDLLAIPQPDTAFLDPFASTPTLGLICNVQDPVLGEPYSRDPRHIAAKASNYLKSTGVADTAYFGPEAEFVVFDRAEFDQTPYESYYRVQPANSAGGGRNGNSDGRGRTELHRISPLDDSLADLRSEIMQALIDCGLDVEAHQPRIATAGKCEIDLRHQSLVTMADWMMIYKHVVRGAARKRGQVATFMPKPLMSEPGNGMHTHFSLWRDNAPLFAGGGYAGLSEAALYAIGGILRHAPAILAFSNPATNSYKRLVPGHEAPVYLTYSQRNRSAAIRIPTYSQNPRAKRIEFRCPDPSCNPYLTFSAILMAAIDGIQLKLHPGPAIDRNMFEAPPGELASLAHVPGTLDESLRALEEDSEFLLRDDVFTPDVLEHWIAYKRKHEVEAFRLRPHPYEFCLYFDV